MTDEVVETPPPAEAPAEAEAPAAPETPAAVEEKPADEKPAEDAGPLAPRFSALAKREKEITLRERKVKEELAAKEKELADKLARVEAYEKQRATWEENPIAFLDAHGITYQKLTERVLKDGEPPTADDRVAKLEAEIAADRKAREEEKAAAKKAEEEARRQAIEEETNAFKAKIQDFVKENAEKYELVAAEGAHDVVFDLIESHYAATAKKGKPELLDVARAAELVEEHLFEEAAKRYKGSKKLGSLFAPAPLGNALPVAPTAAAAVAAAAKAKPQLTNKVGAAATPPAAKKPLLDAREIAAKFKAERKNRNASA